MSITDAEVHNRAMFIRQRRNLMGMSAVIMCIIYAGLQFEKINILGNEFYITNAQAVNTVLLILLAYWLLRYYQYFKSLGNTDIYLTYKSRLSELIRPLIVEQLRKSEADRISVITKMEIEGRGNLLNPVSAINPFFKKSYQIFFRVDKLREDSEYETGKTEYRTIDLESEIMRDLVLWLRAVTFTAFTTPLITEYILPFAMAFSAVGFVDYHYL